MFSHKKGTLLLLLYFMLSLAGLLLFDVPVNCDMEQNRVAYDYYLKQVEGKCTEKTDSLLSEEADRIATANSSLVRLYDDYYDSKLTEQEFNAIIAEAQNTVRYEKGFEVIYEQYSKIREKKENRWFLYTNGWNGLLSYERLNLLFVLLLLLLITPVFCQEYESQMDALILTEKKGARRNAICKINLVLLTVAALCLLDSGMRYGFFALKYGLPHGNYPLQSLSYFAMSTRKITLMGAFLKITAGRLIGSSSFALLIMFVAVCLKRYALTLFTCTTVLLLPYYGFTLPSVKYYLPGPLGFMISTGFFKGSEYQYDAAAREKVLAFQEISTKVRVLTLVITLILMLITAAVIIRKNSNMWCVRKQTYVNKVGCSILVTCLIVSTFSGCSAPDMTRGHILFNLEQNHSFEDERYRVFIDKSDPDNTMLICENKITNEKQRLDLNPMRALVRIPDSIFGLSDYVYYIRIDTDESMFFPVTDRISIIEIDMRTFNEKLVFERNLNTNRDTFLNIGSAKNNDMILFEQLEAFFLDNKFFYFIYDGKVFRYSRLTGKMKLILEVPVLKSLAFDGTYIYYINEKSLLMQYNVRTDIETEFFDIVTESFLLTKTDVIFMNRLDQNRIYAMNRANGTARKTTEEPALSFSVEDNIIDYTRETDLQQRRIKLN
jgi:hypothetical protein